MFNIFEQPWTLLGVSVLVLLGVFTFRSVWPERRKPWQLLLPLIVAGSAFGLDALVTTDLEKVHAVTRASIRAVENEDCRGIALWIASDYRDSRHASKADLIKHCQEQLTGPTIAKIKKLGDNVELSGGHAVVTLILSIKFDEQGRIAKQYDLTSCLAKVQFSLAKQPDGRWLINRVEILEVDHIPVTWNSV